MAMKELGAGLDRGGGSALPLADQSMLEDRKRPRPRNVRRGARSTLVFRVVISACVLGLFLVVWNVSGAVRGMRKDLAAGGGASAGPASGSSPAAGELGGVKKSLGALRSELTTARADQVRELAELRRQAAAERQELEARLVDLEARLAALGEAPAEPEPVTGVEVVPPPEDGSEDPDLVPSPPETDGSGEESIPVPPVIGGDEPEGGSEEPEPEPEPEYEEYTIRRGDTVSGIAVRFRVEMDELLELNGIEDPRRIQVGQVLKIPK